MADATFVIQLKAEEDISRVLKAAGVSSVNDLTNIDEATHRAQRRLDRMGRTGERALKLVGRQARRLGSTLGRAVISPLGQITGLLGAFGAIQGIRTVTRDASDFQTTMAEVATILPEAAGGVEEFGARVRAIAISQNQLQTDVGKGLYQTISGGISDAADALKVLEASSRLGTAGLATTTESVDLLTTTLNALKRGVEDVDEISDDYFTTVRLGKTTISELAASIGGVLPQVNTLGISLRENNAAFAALTQQGFATSEAVTLLSALYSSLIKNIDNVDEVLARNGKTFDLNTIRTRGLLPVLKDLRAGLTDEAEALEVLGARRESFNAILGLTGKNAITVERALRDLADSAGATDAALEKIIGTDAFKVSQAFGALRIEASKLGDAVLSGAAGLIEDLGGVEGVQRRLAALVEGLVPLVEGGTRGVLGFASDFISFGDDVNLAVLKIQDLTNSLRDYVDILNAANPFSDTTALTKDTRNRANLDVLVSQGARGFEVQDAALRESIARSLPSLDLGAAFEDLGIVEALKGQLFTAEGEITAFFSSIRNQEEGIRRSAAASLEALGRSGEAADIRLRDALNAALPILNDLERIRISGTADDRESRSSARAIETEARARAQELLVEQERALQERIVLLGQTGLGILDERIAAQERFNSSKGEEQAALKEEIRLLEEQRRLRRLGIGQIELAAGEVFGPAPPPGLVRGQQAVAEAARFAAEFSGHLTESNSTLEAIIQQFDVIGRGREAALSARLSLSGLFGGGGSGGARPEVLTADERLQQEKEMLRLREIFVQLDGQVADNDAVRLRVRLNQIDLQREAAILELQQLGASREQTAELERQFELLRDRTLDAAAAAADAGGPAGAGGRPPSTDRLTKLHESRNERLALTSVLAQLETATETATARLFEDFILGAKSAKEAFQDFAKEVVRQLITIAAQAAAAQIFTAIVGGVTGGVGGVAVATTTSGAGGGGGSSGVGSSAGSSGFAPAFAPSGGASGFAPLGPGAGGTTVIVHAPVQVSATDAASFEQRISQVSDAIARGVETKIKRSNSFRSVIRGASSGRG